MDPIFIYYDKVKFQNEYKIFNIDFSDGDNLQAVSFLKNRLLHNEHVLFYKNNARSDRIKSL